MKTIIIDGRRFTISKGKKYHYNSSLRKHLHQYVWEKEHGPIPKGYEIHHIDGNTMNNDITNLMMVTIKEHKEIHANNISEERMDYLRKNLDKNARPKAIKWHKSEKGSEWHKKHYETMKEKLHAKHEFKCECCGEIFEGVNNGVNRFCSNKCISRFRRMNGLDNVVRKCVTCGKEFSTNKYKKTINCSKSCSSKMKWENRKLKDSPNLQE